MLFRWKRKHSHTYYTHTHTLWLPLKLATNGTELWKTKRRQCKHQERWYYENEWMNEEQLLVFFPLVWLFYIMARTHCTSATRFIHVFAISPFFLCSIFFAVRIKFPPDEKNRVLFFFSPCCKTTNITPTPYNRCAHRHIITDTLRRRLLRVYTIPFAFLSTLCGWPKLMKPSKWEIVSKFFYRSISIHFDLDVEFSRCLICFIANLNCNWILLLSHITERRF